MNSPGHPLPIFRLALLALLSAIVLSGCASSRKAPATVLKKRGADYLMHEMVQRQFAPNWMSARARIKYDDEYLSVGGTANLLLRRDSMIWLSVRKLGFEVARALITPDSVHVIDRLNNEYLAEGLDYLAREYKVPADFKALQAIILGNPVLFSRKGFSVTEEEPLYHIEGSDGQTESHYWLKGDGLLLYRMAFEDRRSDRQLQVEMGDYQPAGSNAQFAYSRQLNMRSQDTGPLSVRIDFSQVEFDIPKSVRFEVPERYTRSD